MLSKFFIEHPVLASVISVLIVLGGLAVYPTLPVAQYPEITPPIIRVTTNYPGASAQVVADTVAAPIEQQVNGVDNMLYMISTSASDGSYQLEVTFELGTNVDIATVLVQNRVAQASAQLPDDVKRQGVTTQKRSTQMIGIVTLAATNDEARKVYDDLYLANYFTINVRDELLRIKGVGDAMVRPQKDYGMRVWLDPEKLKARALTTCDVVAALREQNVQVAAGVIGQSPAPKGQIYQFTVSTLGRLAGPDQFGDIIVKTSTDGRITRLKEVARIELGARCYDVVTSVDRGPGAIMLLYQSPGANAVQVATQVKKALAKMRETLPQGLDLQMKYDVSDFIQSSIKEVYITLIEAFVLVLIVVMVFLRSFRATLVPVTTVPVSIIGTFIGMAIFGFSINFLTLFGLILAIGIVVDDAIVVVENVERVMTERRLPVKEATIAAMAEILSPILSITLVLMAVFIPTALLPGITGQMYRQFALTIAISTFISALNALTLKPVQCTKWLRPHVEGHAPGLFSRAFESVFNTLSNAYARLIRFGISGWKLGVTFALFAGAMAMTYHSIRTVPTGFLPIEDRGMVMVDLQMPDSASQERTAQVMRRVEDILSQTDGVRSTTTFAGMSILNGNASNFGFAFGMLTSWEERYKRGRGLDTILRELRGKFSTIQEGRALAFTLPAIDGVGNVSGFDLRVQDRQAVGNEALQVVADEMVAAGNAQTRLRAVNSAFRAGVPQVFIDIDREKVKKMGVPLDTVFNTLQAYLGSTYVNDFNRFGRTWQVNVQAESQFRAHLRDALQLEFRNPQGGMIPLGAVAKIVETRGPDRVIRYNMFPSAQITGDPAPGASTGQALDIMEQMARETLPPGMSYEWSALSYQEKKAEGQGNLLFGLAIVVVVLILAGQYESWSTPVAVILTCPLAILGAMMFLLWWGRDNNVYTTIGLVLLVGLGAKNAILIIQFAREHEAKGAGLIDAVVEGARTRFRPILMTSFAFILGCVPLMTATGAGAAGRVSLGTAVVGGMLANTMLGLLFTPMLYVVVQRVTRLFARKEVPTA